MKIERAVAVRVERPHEPLAVVELHLVARGDADGELELEVVEEAVAGRVVPLEDLAQPRLAVVTGRGARPLDPDERAAHLRGRRAGSKQVELKRPRSLV